MQVIDQKRISLLSLMGMAEGTLNDRYVEAGQLVDRMVEDGWFGGPGKLSKPSRPSARQGSPSPSKSDRPATKRQVQRVIDLDDTYNVEDLEAMSYDEIRDLILKLK